jgi:alkanesulfonate monooxygenase SsuD/methylene tetrahydromethanopterin reductase-like flavin-dependent oxidoreductase (luciferase family)
VDLGVHLPLMQFGKDRLTLERLVGAVDAARDGGFAAVSANDHFVFQTPWLDGPTALANMIERSGRLTLATTISLAVLRAPVPLAKALAAIDLLSGGRLIAALGPGSSKRDYDALGVPFDERWKRFDEALAMLRPLLAGEAVTEDARYYPVPSDLELAPAPYRRGGVPLWVGSWGSPAGIARVARAGDGWLASAYNTTPAGFAAGRAALERALAERGRDADGFPNALSTMWTWVAKDDAERDRVLTEVLAPLLRRDRDELGAQVCVGSAEHCAELLSRYADAGCQRVYLWPLGDERRQLELVASEVAPLMGERVALGRHGCLPT